MKEHQNGEGANGYWVGAAITAPEGTTIDKYYFSKTAYTAESTLNDTAEEDKQTIEFYVNAGNENKVTYAAVKLSDGNTYVYAIDTTNVKKYVVKSAVTMGTVTGGTATVTGATDLTSVAEGTELTVVANTPALGYVAANPTITVTKTGDADTTVTVTEGKFTMPAYPVTVTVAYAADPTMKVIDAEASTWVKDGDTTAHNTDEILKINQLAPSGKNPIVTNEATLLKYDLSSIDKEKIIKAELNMSMASASYNDSRNRWESTQLVYGVLSNSDWAETATYSDVSSLYPTTVVTVSDWLNTQDDKTSKTEANGAFSENTVEITDTVKATTTNDLSLVLGTFTTRAQLIKKAPKLVVEVGQLATFNVTSGETKVADATVEVKKGDTVVATTKTNANGVAKVALASGDYTYTVTSADYAIKTGSIKVADSAVTENVALTANVATKVEIANPATGTTLAQGEEATYTATVKDQDGRAMTATVDWSVVNGEDVAAENITVANGKVNVAEEATAGDYKVKATVNGTKVSATADLKVIAAEKLNLSITSQDAKQGTVAYTVNGVASTDTQLNKGKKIVATATPAALYEFVGWVTSTENLITGTYVSTDAQYSFDLTANTTLIAVFKYTGIYASMNFDSSTVGTKVSGNNMLALGGVGSWSMGGPNSGSNGEIKAASDIAAFTTASGNVYYTSGNNVEGNLKTTAIPVKDNSVNFKMDMYFTAAGTGDTSFAIGDNSESQSVLFLKVAANATSGLTADNISDGAAVTTQNIYYYDYATQKWVKTDLKPGVLSIDETVNADGTATVKLNETTINLTSVPVDTIGSVTDFTFNGIRVDGSHKGTMTFYVDNIEVSKVTSTSGN